MTSKTMLEDCWWSAVAECRGQPCRIVMSFGRRVWCSAARSATESCAVQHGAVRGHIRMRRRCGPCEAESGMVPSRTCAWGRGAGTEDRGD